MSRLLDNTADPELRAGAFAHLGAAQVALGMPAAGAASLDSAVAVRAAAARDPFVNLWRARGAFGTRDDARGWAELERAESAAGPVALDARLEMADRALSSRDSARLRSAVATLLADASAAFFADSVAALAHGASLVWGFPFGYSVLATGARSSWPAEQRYRMNLARSGLAAAAGDTAVAVADASRIAGSATGATADQARVLAARWRLATVDGLEKLSEIRALLLPAVAHAGARELLGAMRTLDVLLEFAGERGEPLGMFAAGEIARDSLNAPVLARGLFLTYADFAPETPWVGKALIAALHLSVEPAAADSVRARIEARPDDVYLRAVTGDTDADAFAAAEQRLGRDLITLRFEAGQEAGRRDLGVARAVARLDSVRIVARGDSIARQCGARIDSLALRGIRADSVRAACLRSDSRRVGMLLKIDTLLLREPKTREDSLRLRRRNRAGIDTLWPRR
jgi:hypothetical protein